METRAVAKNVRIAPRKVRRVVDLVRGKYVEDALRTLQFLPNRAAKQVHKVVKSAAANAENNFAMDTETLKITTCYVDVGPTMKRMQPRAMGRAYRILKRSSHITVVVGEGPPKPVKQRAARRRPQVTRGDAGSARGPRPARSTPPTPPAAAPPAPPAAATEPDAE
jgi:large subunit ribosomal protein L22